MMHIIIYLKIRVIKLDGKHPSREHRLNGYKFAGNPPLAARLRHTRSQLVNNPRQGTLGIAHILG